MFGHFLYYLQYLSTGNNKDQFYPLMFQEPKEIKWFTKQTIIIIFL